MWIMVVVMSFCCVQIIAMEEKDPDYFLRRKSVACVTQKFVMQKIAELVNTKTLQPSVKTIYECKNNEFIKYSVTVKNIYGESIVGVRLVEYQVEFYYLVNIHNKGWSTEPESSLFGVVSFDSGLTEKIVIQEFHKASNNMYSLAPNRLLKRIELSDELCSALTATQRQAGLFGNKKTKTRRGRARG